MFTISSTRVVRNAIFEKTMNISQNHLYNASYFITKAQIQGLQIMWRYINTKIRICIQAGVSDRL